MSIRKLLQNTGPILLAAVLCAATPALADGLKTITIDAGVTTRSVVGRSTIGAPVEEVTITHRVSYADLDLATRAGAEELRSRVQETARAACKQLDTLYPLEDKNAPECAGAAVAAAASQVESAIAAVRREAGTR